MKKIAAIAAVLVLGVLGTSLAQSNQPVTPMAPCNGPIVKDWTKWGGPASPVYGNIHGGCKRGTGLRFLSMTSAVWSTGHEVRDGQGNAWSVRGDKKRAYFQKLDAKFNGPTGTQPTGSKVPNVGPVVAGPSLPQGGSELPTTSSVTVVALNQQIVFAPVLNNVNSNVNGDNNEVDIEASPTATATGTQTATASNNTSTSTAQSRVVAPACQFLGWTPDVQPGEVVDLNSNILGLAVRWGIKEGGEIQTFYPQGGKIQYPANEGGGVAMWQGSKDACWPMILSMAGEQHRAVLARGNVSLGKMVDIGGNTLWQYGK